VPSKKAHKKGNKAKKSFSAVVKRRNKAAALAALALLPQVSPDSKEEKALKRFIRPPSTGFSPPLPRKGKTKAF
jgi:hypothetical protein